MTYTFTHEAATDEALRLVCDACGESVCEVESGEDLDVIVRMTADHGDVCAAESLNQEDPTDG